MPGLGTIVNAAAIILGGLAGLLFGKLIKPRIQETIMMACGVCVIFLGIAGAMEKMLTSSADGTGRSPTARVTADSWTDSSQLP